jgi:hypothetical protein
MTVPVEAMINLPASESGLPGRSCGTCTLCCRLPEIDELSKPANEWCVNCVAGKGCAIYDDRPKLCRDFLCFWMVSERLGPEWDPSTANMMVYRQGQQITVLVDPAHPSAWRREPYSTQLRQWAVEARERGGYIIVFAGDDIFKIDPIPPRADASVS